LNCWSVSSYLGYSLSRNIVVPHKKLQYMMYFKHTFPLSLTFVESKSVRRNQTCFVARIFPNSFLRTSFIEDYYIKFKGAMRFLGGIGEV